MYLAPLNYDRFFKKVFADVEISGKFIEDFFDIELEEIELLDLDHKLTDEANVVRFDFRCKANGKYFIIDMQQWYKQDIVQRFYTYHALNTVLQLENLPVLTYPEVSKKVKTYDQLAPVKTLIWMVHDKLGFEDDFISFVSLPQSLETFLQDKAWEEGGFERLLKERNVFLKVLENDSKHLKFLRRNELIFAFQKNIIQNKKLEKYVRWFEFAERTRNEDNTESDFEGYAKDEVFSKMMSRLSKNHLQDEDYSYLRYYHEWEGIKDSVAELSKEEGIKEGEKMGIEKGEEREKNRIALNGIEAGLNNETIAALTSLSVEEIEKLRQE